MERIAAQEKVIEVMIHEMEAIAERRQVTAAKDQTSVLSLPPLRANPTDVHQRGQGPHSGHTRRGTLCHDAARPMLLVSVDRQMLFSLSKNSKDFMVVGS